MINLDFVPKEVVGFGLCGVVLDLTFVLVLSAAHDVVLSSGESTSVVLAASIFPLLALKMTAPLLMQHLSYHLRVAFATGSACWALCAIAVAPTLWTKLLLGVAVGAVSTGLAEVTFFALASRYSTSCLVALSTGTGLSGIAGSGLYFVFTQILHYSVKNTLIFTSVLPISLLLCYFLFLTPIPAPHQDIEAVQETDHQLPSAYDPLLGEVVTPDSSVITSITTTTPTFHLTEKLHFIYRELLVQYMLPLFVIFFTGYLINQGVVPEISFASPWINPSAQYVLFYFTANVGSVLSRGCSYIIEVDNIHFLASTQLIVLGTFFFHIFYQPIIPNFTVMLVLALFGGVVNGMTFVNAFRLINERTEKGQWREFAMGVASVADAFGVAIASIFGILLQRSITSK